MLNQSTQCRMADPSNSIEFALLTCTMKESSFTIYNAVCEC